MSLFTCVRFFAQAHNDVLIEVLGTGINTIGLVREAVRRKGEAESHGERFIAIWCVFDRDDFPAQHFNEAFDTAIRHNIRVAYANQCFELWYWLHFDLQQTSVSRDEYASKLSERLKRAYHKADESLYSELKPHQHAAIRNSKKLLSFYGAGNPERDDPSTTVHTLVEYLNEFES
jgi:hypothetical protein